MVPSVLRINLVDPKASASAVTIGAASSGSVRRKGIGLIFPNTVTDYGILFDGDTRGGNASELGDA